jgi:hypothetical protein
MKPKINGTKFGSITIQGETYEKDVIIRLNGAVEKRKKKLSKEIFGTAHVVSKAEAQFVYEEGAARLIVGSGQTGMVRLSADAAEYFKKRDCQVDILPTPKAIEAWNKVEGKAIGLFHVTC